MKSEDIKELKDILIYSYVYDDYILLLPKDKERKLNAILKEVKLQDLHKYKEQIVKFILENSHSEKYYVKDVQKDFEVLDLLKEYKRNIDLRGIKNDIYYLFGTYANSIYMYWSNPNGTPIDVVAQQLEYFGIYFKSQHPTDIFCEFIKLYNDAKTESKVVGKPLRINMDLNQMKKYEEYLNKTFDEYLSEKKSSTKNLQPNK